MKPSAKELLSKTTAEIIEVLGTIYEHSSWVAEILTSRPRETYASVETISQLAAIMKDIVDNESNDMKLTLLRAHPDLCEKVGTLELLTPESQEEQSKSGLQSLTNEELERFTLYNSQYRKKFGFPFILAVRNVTKYTVLLALQGRVTNNTFEVEFVTALQQVHKIAWMRLLSKLKISDAKGYLTCHVLDTANGCPGKLSSEYIAACFCTYFYNPSFFTCNESFWYEDSVTSNSRLGRSSRYSSCSGVCHK